MRTSFLRWLTYEDIDAWKRVHIESPRRIIRNTECHRCGADGPNRAYPHGMFGPCYCKDHSPFGWQDFADEGLRKVAGITESPRRPARLDGRRPPHVPPLCPCGLCGLADATVYHWLSDCPVVRVAFIKLKLPDLPLFLRGQASDIDFIRGVHLVHQIRLLVLRAGGIFADNPVARKVGTQVDTLDDLLQSFRQYAHPAILTPCIIDGIRPLKKPLLHIDTARVMMRTLPGDQGRRRPSEQVLSIVDPAQPGEVILTIPRDRNGTPCVHLAVPGITWPTKAPKHNAVWRLTLCDCFRPCAQLIATSFITRGEPICVPEDMISILIGKWILARFDGSCKKPGTEDAACGAGIVIYICYGDRAAHEIRRISVPLPQANSSPQAEAHGAVIAALLATDIQKKPEFAEHNIHIQGDNQAIIDFCKGKARINDDAMRNIVAPVVEELRLNRTPIYWEHLYRKYNKTADMLAGVAAKIVRATGRHVGPGITIAGYTVYDMPVASVNGFSHADKIEDFDVNQTRAVLAANLDGSAPTQPLCLPEKVTLPDIDFNHFDDRIVTAVVAFIAAGVNSTCYTPKHGPIGRHYPVSGIPAIANNVFVPKTARWILLHDHNELDIQLCHFAVMLATNDWTASLGPLYGQVDDVLAFVAKHLSPTDDTTATDTMRNKAAKVVLQRIITTDTTNVKRQVDKECGFTINATLAAELQFFDQVVKKTAARRMNDMGYWGHDNHNSIESRNRLYFACEAVEARLLLRTIYKLMHGHGPRSIILLHDGIYVHNSIDIHSLKNAFDAAVSQEYEETGILPVKVRITPCAQKLVEYIQGVPRPDNFTTSRTTTNLNALRTILHDQAEHGDEAIALWAATFNQPLGRLRLKQRRKERWQRTTPN